MLWRVLSLKATKRAARMKRFFSHELMNLGILAHIDAGKTTISEDILYNANEIKVKGSINDQNTQLDFLRQERERGITIKTAYSCFKWNNVKVNLIDTPGHVDFSNETFLSLCVSDKCVIVVDAKEGIQIQTFHLFHYIKENLPIFFFLNKMDIHETDLDYNIENLKKKLSPKSVLVTYPLYENKVLKFILDLPSMSLYWYPQWKYGKKFTYNRIHLSSVLQHMNCNIVRNHLAAIGIDKVDSTAPEVITTERLLRVLSRDTIHHVLQKREELVEALCDLEPDLEHKYINNICIQYSELRKCLSKWINRKKIFPVLSGSALNSLGVHLLLDYVTSSGVAVADDHHSQVKTHPSAVVNTSHYGTSTTVVPPSSIKTTYPYMQRYKTVLFIFKLVSEKNGHNTFCKVLKGELVKNAKVLNLRSGGTEVVKGLYKVKADRYVMINMLKTNDIGMVRGLEHVLVCDFMCELEELPCNIDCSNMGGGDRLVSTTILRSNDCVSDQKRKKKNDTIKQNIQHNQNNSLQDIYKYMKYEIDRKELWFFLKNYKKRISKNVIVCTCAIEPKDCKKESELKQVLRNICLEDNSIVVYTDPNRKIVIGSIGILNIEVTLDKIRNDYNIDIRTEEVEVVEKEYLTGKYEETITKEMKVNSNLSNITIGLTIREKEFVDVSRFIQNALRYDSVSKLVGSTKGQPGEDPTIPCISIGEKNSEKQRITMIQPSSSLPTELNRRDSVFCALSQRGNMAPNEPSCRIEVELNNSDEEVSGSVGWGKFTTEISINGNCEGGRISGSRDWANSSKDDSITRAKHPDEDVEENTEKDDDDDVDEDVDEYLLNFNYEDLFKSSVRVHKDVHLYIADLQSRKKKKKNFYEEILQSCIVTLKNCLSSGFQTSGSIISTEVEITKLDISDDTTVAVAKYACNDLYYRMIRQANVCVAKPISLLQIQTEESFVGNIVKDLIQQRSGTIIQIAKNNESRLFKSMKIIAIVPVKHTHNYASILRSISSGHANCLMTFCGYSREG
ncbi:tetQ family GTPase, putative [Plasmodium knowlesi strain H]|uniref:TetQ family GTPase, putative n=3 Tax=Plasmodium knowlesi TaxID=5850 RepID=A0A5K1VPC9_PLAKH|nr:tetQ family GTPase, putative [Plasmodium knowlesi strain H]OTN64146.1 putative TetQ family GTPase [Plasmodium knowlesi]CAA9991147.1 tetQ family GTPase, putative [Plasmodium knowlesi strain H]SBO27118.1 tetQ family GTPase, putative [Plasmodium knowlesi strain H]SBO29355.1 tetQ family GTPase, putative [Plasmodium knowlesi strain H]VVS80621.1 tetQ family GTPase, putative [Plasmodium knowlesi strain H]|eukprot:XP_002262440.1 TetQ family GTPase, putative [Plasmodium knowlesi strain H]